MRGDSEALTSMDAMVEERSGGNPDVVDAVVEAAV